MRLARNFQVQSPLPKRFFLGTEKNAAKVIKGGLNPATSRLPLSTEAIAHPPSPVLIALRKSGLSAGLPIKPAPVPRPETPPQDSDRSAQRPGTRFRCAKKRPSRNPFYFLDLSLRHKARQRENTARNMLKTAPAGLPLPPVPATAHPSSPPSPLPPSPSRVP